MSYKRNAIVVGVLTLGASVLQIDTAAALTLSYEETSTGQTGPGTGTSYLSLPVSDAYSHIFAPSTRLSGSVAGTSFNFIDDFIFSVQTAHADAITSTINFENVLDISDLAVRLYNYNGTPSSLPLTGNAGAMSGWSTTTQIAPGTSSIVNVLDVPQLNAGTYVLEVAGDLTGTAGGTYTGSLDLEPVPLPAALPLLLSGLGLLGGAVRRRT